MNQKFTPLTKPARGIKRFRAFCAALLLGLGLAHGVALAKDPHELLFKYVSLRINNVSAKAEVADTPVLQQRGLMFRQALKEDHGMVFVFAKPERYCMWMKNTPLALSVAFIDLKGRILNIESMEPFTETSHCARSPVTYALEMEKGWFHQRGIGVGDLVQGLPTTPASGF